MTNLAVPRLPDARERDGASADEHILRGIVADEIDAARGGLEALVSALCADAHVVSKHLPLLQSIDEISQHYENLAHILRADDMAGLGSGPIDMIGFM